MSRPTQDSRIDEWLAGRDAGSHLVGLGLEGLIARWEATADDIEAGRTGDLDEYLNDLDLRRLIDEVLTALPDTRGPLLRRLRAADGRVREATVPVEECLWGAAAAARHGWNRRRQWWYHAVPRRLSEDLAEDLAVRGITRGATGV